MKSKVYFVELQMQGEKHSHVNSGLLQIVNNTFNNRIVEVYCDSIHKQALLKNMSVSEGIKFNTFKYSGDKEFKKIYSLNKLLRETVLAYQIFRKAQAESTEIIIFASGHPFTVLLLNLFSVYFMQRIVVCLHGEIGVLALKTNKITTKVFVAAVKLFFINQGKRVITLFYGDSIKYKLFSLLPIASTNSCISIDHPYTYLGKTKNTTIKSPVTLVCIGTGRIKKNSHLIYKLAELCANNIDKKKLVISQCGDISSEVLKYSNSYVTKIVYENQFIPSEKFEAALLEADYFLYFFSENSLYDLSPSGTFFDAIKYQTPIIALHNPFFDYYFKKLGNIGYLCESIDDMSSLINEISSLKRTDEYSEQVKNLLNAQSALSIENITSSFSNQYDELTKKLCNTTKNT